MEIDNSNTPVAQEQQTPSGGGISNAAAQMEGKQEVDPRTQKEMDSYVASLMYVMHNPKTNKNVVDMLGSGPPEQSIPATAMYINDAVEKTFSKKIQGPVRDEVKLHGAIYLASDLSELGNAARVWEEPVTEQKLPSLFQSIVSKYVHKGLKEGTIDPIKLQADTEPILNEQQRAIGSRIQQELGLPGEPTASMGIDTLIRNKTKPMEDENAKLKATLAQQQQMQAAQQNQQGKR